MTAMTEYPNWFKLTAERNFERFLLPLAGKPGLRFLQIGAFTGDASVWLLDNVLTGTCAELFDVDTWQGSDESAHAPFDWHAVERFYDERTVEARQTLRLTKCKETSAEFFAETWALTYGVDHPPFDFIYVDGAHDAATVLEDGVHALACLKVGGLLAFDDYQWHSPKGATHEPAVAVDSIAACYADRLEVLEVGAQVWFRRVA